MIMTFECPLGSIINLPRVAPLFHNVHGEVTPPQLAVLTGKINIRSIIIDLSNRDKFEFLEK